MRNRGRRPTICPETCLVDPYYEPKHLRQKLSNLANVSGELDGQSETRLLVLYTGGTIGMKTNSDGGKFSSPLVMHDNSQLRWAFYQVNVLACLIFRWFKCKLKPPYSIAHDKLRLAIWDTSFWTFWLKFGHKGP